MASEERGKPKQRTPTQVLAVNQWLDEEHETPLPPELLLVINDLISDWAPPAHPNPKHLRAYANIVKDSNVELAHVPAHVESALAAAAQEREPSSRDALPSPYFEVDRNNASMILCARQEFEPAHCHGAQSFAPGHSYHVQLRMTSGSAVEGHQQMQLVGTADGAHGHASNGSSQMSFSCSTEAFPRDTAAKEGSTSMVDILIDLPRNSKRLQVGTVSVRSEGGHRQLMVRSGLPLTLYALVLCGAENCVECGVGTCIEVLSSETVTKEEFKQLLATQVERVPQKRGHV